MGTKKETTQTNQYDPTSMSAFKGLTPAWANAAKSWIQSPYSNPQFQLEQQMGTRQAQNLGQTGINQLFQNQTASGFGGGVQSPFMQEMLANQGRANTGLQSQLGFIQPMLNALQRQQYGMGLAQSYHPLQTGQKQVEATSGLGTWLPQVANLAMGLATGGMSSGAQGAMGMMKNAQSAFNFPGGGGFGGATYANYDNALTPPGGGGWGGGGGMMPWLNG